MSIINQALKKTQQALEENAKLKETSTLKTNTQLNSQIITSAQKKTVRQELKKTIHQAQAAVSKEKIIEKPFVQSQNQTIPLDQSNQSQLNETINTIIKNDQREKKQRKTYKPKAIIEPEKSQPKLTEKVIVDKNLQLSIAIKSKKITIIISSILLLTIATYWLPILTHNKTKFSDSLSHDAKNSHSISTVLTENASIPILNGTILMGNDSVAVLDHHSMHVGEELDGYKVAQIHLNDVELENLHTHEYVTINPKLNS